MKAPHLWFELTLGALITLTCIWGFAAYVFFRLHSIPLYPSPQLQPIPWELMRQLSRIAGVCLGIVWAALIGYVIIKGELRVRRRMVERSRSFWLGLLILQIYLAPGFYVWAHVFAGTTIHGLWYFDIFFTDIIVFIVFFVGTLFAFPAFLLIVLPIYMVPYFAIAYGTLFLCYRTYDRWKKKGVTIEYKH